VPGLGCTPVPSFLDALRPVGVLWTFSTVVELLRLPVTEIAIITGTTIPTTSRIQRAALMMNPCVCTVIANAMIARPRHPG
jgi:hypothetical protein